MKHGVSFKKNSSSKRGSDPFEPKVDIPVPTSPAPHQEVPGKTISTPREKITKEEKFKQNLLRKRRTYTKYFEANLSTIDEKLTKIAMIRGVRRSSAVLEWKLKFTSQSEKMRMIGHKPSLPARLDKALQQLQDANRVATAVGSEMKKKSKKHLARHTKKQETKWKRLAIIKEEINKERRQAAALMNPGPVPELIPGQVYGHESYYTIGSEAYYAQVCGSHHCQNDSCIKHWTSMGFERVSSGSAWTKKPPPASAQRRGKKGGKGKKK